MFQQIKKIQLTLVLNVDTNIPNSQQKIGQIVLFWPHMNQLESLITINLLKKPRIAENSQWQNSKNLAKLGIVKIGQISCSKIQKNVSKSPIFRLGNQIKDHGGSFCINIAHF